MNPPLSLASLRITRKYLPHSTLKRSQSTPPKLLPISLSAFPLHSSHFLLSITLSLSTPRSFASPQDNPSSKQPESLSCASTPIARVRCQLFRFLSFPHPVLHRHREISPQPQSHFAIIVSVKTITNSPSSDSTLRLPFSSTLLPRCCLNSVSVLPEWSSNRHLGRSPSHRHT